MLKAFHVWDNSADEAYEQCHEIVFAETHNQAKYKSEAYENHGEYLSIRAKRAKMFDEYAEVGKIPKEVMIKHGWGFECGCSMMVYEEAIVINNEVYCKKCVPTETEKSPISGEEALI